MEVEGGGLWWRLGVEIEGWTLRLRGGGRVEFEGWRSGGG